MSTEIQETEVILPDVRVGYPHLFVAVPYKKGDDKNRFSITSYLPKSDEETKARIDTIVRDLVKENMEGVMPKKKDLPFSDGDGEDEAPEAQGNWVLRAYRPEFDSQDRPNPPQVMRLNTAVTNSQNNPVYAGCRCNVMLRFYYHTHWKRICLQVEIVQFKRDDEAFGAVRPSINAMPEIADEEEEGGGFDV